MKTKLLLLLIGLVVSTATKAQIWTFDSSNSKMRIARVQYTCDSQGFWHKKDNILLDKVSGIKSIYAYNKKTQELFVKTDNANCIITLLDDGWAKFYKKNESVPKLKDEELEAAIEKANKELEEEYSLLNKKRQNEIDEARRKAYNDSVLQARDDSMRLVRQKERADNYRKTHSWNWVPIDNTYLSCAICEDKANYDSTYVMAIRNDSIFWISLYKGYLGTKFLQAHAAKIPGVLKTNEKFKYHCEIFKDSLLHANPNFDMIEAVNFSLERINNNREVIRKTVPNGFFLRWGWDHEYSNISFDFSFMNTNKKTIKYITVYWKITNDVGDVRKTGYFKGTGPVEQWQAGTWEWDYSSYYVAGDASTMNITKVVIKYMDGTSATIPKNKLYFDDDE